MCRSRARGRFPPLCRQEHIVDVIGGAVLLTIAPIEGRHRFLALLLVPQGVVGAGEAQPLKGGDRVGLIDAPTRSMPVDIVVEIPRHDAWPVDEKLSVFGERPAQGPELVLPANAIA